MPARTPVVHRRQIDVLKCLMSVLCWAGACNLRVANVYLPHQVSAAYVQILTRLSCPLVSSLTHPWREGPRVTKLASTMRI